MYRLTLDDDTTSVASMWNDDEDYWPQAAQDPADLLGHATGIDLFAAAHRELSAVGVRVSEVLLYDRSRTLIAGDVAIVDDVAGGTLERLWQRDPQGASVVLARLGDAVTAVQ